MKSQITIYGKKSSNSIPPSNTKEKFVTLKKNEKNLQLESA